MRMQIQAECRSCLERLIAQTVAAATPDPVRQEAARAAALEILAAEFGPEAIPALIATRFHRRIMALTGNPDPFWDLKQQATARARELSLSFPDPGKASLADKLGLAAAGNALDFFRPLEEALRDMQGPVNFAVTDWPLWSVRLRQPGLLLYLTDNAGEEFFDLPLLRALRHLGWQVIYVVKAGPMQNDLCRADLAASELRLALEPWTDTGAATVGLDLRESSPAFRELFAAADLILAKGMGHFETLSAMEDRRLFFLLQAKCRPVAKALGVNRGDFVFRAACQT